MWCDETYSVLAVGGTKVLHPDDAHVCVVSLVKGSVRQVPPARMQ
jgi:hypothetical protein